MKKLLLMMLAALMCLSVFSGCGTNEPAAPYPLPEGTVKPGNFPAEPPFLYVQNSKTQIQAWRGTYSWYVENDDGTGSGICADSSHPLECKDRVPAIKVAQKTTLTLNFEAAPSKITVKRYNLSTNDHDNYKEIAVTGNQIEVKSGDYLYEVIASWSGQTYSGTVYYAFRTEK